MTKKKLSSKTWLLWIIIFFHVLPVILSAYKDKMSHLDHPSVKLIELRYWLWFFTWWSAWASFLTVIWTIYKLIYGKKSQPKSSYAEQLIDLIVTETNLISGVVFCVGGFLLTIPQKGTIPLPWGGEIEKAYVWIFFNIFWHILGPAAVFYYFWKYSRVDKLVRNKKRVLLDNLINPTIYFFYVLARPVIISYHDKGESYQYPPDYPYPFFTDA